VMLRTSRCTSGADAAIVVLVAAEVSLAGFGNVVVPVAACDVVGPPRALVSGAPSMYDTSYRVYAG
jgi:hypothetical protein